MEQQSEWVQSQVGSLFVDEPAADWDPEMALPRLRQRRQEKTLRRRMAVAAAIVALGSLAFPATRVYAKRCVDACVTGGVLVWSKLQKHAVAERRSAPDFTLVDADGRAVQLSALHGKVVVLNFWATWCRPCRAEMPWFVEFQQRYAGQGLTMIGAALDEDGWKSVRPFLAKLGVNYPIVLADQSLVDSIGKLDAVPATLLIDRSGRIAVMHQGLVDKATYAKEIEAALRE